MSELFKRDVIDAAMEYFDGAVLKYGRERVSASGNLGETGVDNKRIQYVGQFIDRKGHSPAGYFPKPRLIWIVERLTFLAAAHELFGSFERAPW